MLGGNVPNVPGAAPMIGYVAVGGAAMLAGSIPMLGELARTMPALPMLGVKSRDNWVHAGGNVSGTLMLPGGIVAGTIPMLGNIVTGWNPMLEGDGDARGIVTFDAVGGEAGTELTWLADIEKLLGNGMKGSKLCSGKLGCGSSGLTAGGAKSWPSKAVRGSVMGIWP